MVNDASRRRHDSKDELRGPRISARSSDPGLCGNDFRFFRPEATLSTDFVGQQFQIVTHFQSINANPKPDVPRPVSRLRFAYPGPDGPVCSDRESGLEDTL